MTARQEPEDLIEPARTELDQPRLNADEVKAEIGDSEPWDKASEKEEDDNPPFEP